MRKLPVPAIFLILFLSSGCAAVFAAEDSLNREIISILHPRTKKQVELALLQQRVRITRLKDPAEALRLNKEFTEKSIEAGEYDYAASGYNETGYMYQEWKMYYLAIEYFLKGLKMYNDHGLEGKTGYILVGIGNCYFHSSNLAAAMENYRNAVKRFNIEKDLYGTAVANNNMGLTMQKMGNQDSAYWFFNLALETRRNLRSPPLVGHSYYYLGTVKEAQGDTALARKYYKLAIGLLMEGDSNIYLNYDFLSTMADCYTGLGNIFMLQKRYGNALSSFRNAIMICDTIRGRVKVPPIYLAAGEALSGLGRQKESMDFFRIALKVADSARLPADQRDCYEAIMKYFLDTHQLDSALSWFNRYSVLTDRIYTEMMNSRRNEIDISLKNSEIEQEAEARESRNRLPIIFLAITGFLLLLLAAGVVFYIRRQRINTKLAAAEIAARKKAEQELEKVNRELKESIADKDRFISILSHDLRSPFNSILGFTDLLVEETADKNIPEIRNYSRLLQQISRRTFQLLENLLAWSRLQMNNLPFQPSALELNTQVSDAVDTMVVAASKKSIRLRNLTTPGLSVYADANMMQAILRNLIANAVKFTRNGGTVEILSEKEEGFVKVSVKDSGVGIPSGLIDKLFTGGGGTVSSPGTDNEPGNGLGLVLCHHMAVKNGGRIWIESTSEKGTVISFTVPVQAMDAR